MHRDKIFQQKQQIVKDFEFNQQVASVFPDMIKRSVPGYNHIIAMIGVFAGQYCQDHSCVYDLGCSLGASSMAMRHHIKAQDCQIIAVDNSEAMLKQCQQYLEMEESIIPVNTLQADITDIAFQPASVVVLNFTLQFIALDEREALINKIYNALLPGGILILSEKVQLQPESLNALVQQHHWQFKRDNGYSDLEISQKRSSIENVLIPETIDTHLQRLSSTGFPKVIFGFKA